MKITSRLALNQLKRNKKRTLGTGTAIAMSTALITANMSFATSGISSLQECLGADMGDYNGAYNAMIILPAALLTLLIVFMSVTVVSNIFQASANNRIKELGVLKCVGGTKKQIKKTVVSEGLWLSLGAIPVGLVIGTFLGFIGIKVAGVYVDRIVEISKAIAMRSLDIKLTFSVKLITYVIAALVALVTVLVSALKPAKQMSKITAIECVRYSNTKKEHIKKEKTGKLWKKLFGFEGELGERNIKRNKQAFRPAIRALATGICLMLATTGVVSQLNDIRAIMKSKDNLLDVDYISIRDEGDDPVTGRRNDIILHPIESETYNSINEKLDAYGDFEVYGIGSNRESYFAKADSMALTDDMKSVDGIINEYGEMQLDMVSMTDNMYRRLCELSGTEYGGNIMLNTYRYNDFGTEKRIIPFNEDMTEMTIVNPQGEEKTLSVDGYLYRDNPDEWLFDYPNLATVMIIVPGTEARNFDWFCEPGDQEEEFISYAKDVLREYYAIDEEDAYVNLGYTIRISRQDNMVMALNIMLILGEIVMYGFVILLALIGFAGFISTITANFRMRSKEFAVLKSVGMTNKSLKKMIYSESMLCTAKAALKGVIAGILIPLLINLAMRNVFSISYRFPIVAIVMSIAVVFITVLIITALEIKRMKGTSLIETIRMDAA